MKTFRLAQRCLTQAVVALAYWGVSPALLAQEAPDGGEPDAVELDRLEVRGERTQDQIGHDNVYERPISNLYVDREYLERYRGVSTGDVFAGMNGVYNTDNRNGSALFPNIRGIVGNGRIPVTVDGTIQSLDAFLAIRGINNRNYVDPNLFRHIEVEKGPSMTRGIKSGIGGSVAIRTINAGDIIEGDGNWGFEFKTGIGNNSVKGTFDPLSIEGMDYRDIPGAFGVSDGMGIGGASKGLSFSRPLAHVHKRSEVSNFNRANRRLFFAIGHQNQRFDWLAAWSDSQRGNYFSGRHGAEEYTHNQLDENRNRTIRGLTPNLARYYAPGDEVHNTSAMAKSLLLKNNWHLPHANTLSFSFTRNRIEFGEIHATANEFVFADLEYREDRDASNASGLPYPLTRVDQNVYKIGWQMQPENSTMLDLDVGLWRTVSNNARYHNGDGTYQVKDFQPTWDRWSRCAYRWELNEQMERRCQIYLDNGLIPPLDQPPTRDPNIDGRYNVIVGTRQITRSVRNGVDISNRFQLAEGLNLIASADWQYERRNDHRPTFAYSMLPGIYTMHLGPASGRRNEYGAGLNLTWKANSRLTIDIGARYGHYWSFDDEMDRARRDREWENWSQVVAQRLEWSESIPDEPGAAIRELRYRDQELSEEEKAVLIKIMKDYCASLGQSWRDDCQVSEDGETGLFAVRKYYDVPLHSGKADRHKNPFYNGELDVNEVVENPQGIIGKFPRYSGLTRNEFSSITPDDPWQRPEKWRLGAWSAQFSAAYQLGKRSQFYARLGSMARFPGLLESASPRNEKGSVDFDLRNPERNLAWEAGYTHKLGGLLPGFPSADIRISYYHNTIRNFFDRLLWGGLPMATIQFERRIMSGIELQSRFDAGRFHGGFGISKRLRQEMCDKDYATMLSPYHRDTPECMTGGLPGSLSWFGLQPRHSINMDLGMRVLSGKLQFGTRIRYHSEAENKEMERWVENDMLSYKPLEAATTPYSWASVKLLDLYAEYRIRRNISARLSVDNLTDRYYLDPLARSANPGPGRTVMLDFAIKL